MLDDNTLKVMARFTPVGENWPNGVWVCIVYIYSGDWKGGLGWYMTEVNTNKRFPDELSESEANQKGYFRDETRTTKSYTLHNQ